MQTPTAIAINTRLLVSGKTEGIARFAIEILKRWVKLWPNCTFYFLFDRKPSPEFIFAENVKPIVLQPMARHPVLYYIWFHIVVKRWLKNNGNPPFFSPEGYLSLFYKGIQFNTIHDLNFEEYPKYLPKAERFYYKTFFPKYAKKSQHIFTVSEFSKQCLEKNYDIDSNKISVTYNAVDFNSTNIINDEENHKQYLLYVGSLHPRKNLKTLVDAFLLLKKKDVYKNLELHIVGLKMWGTENWQKDIKDDDSGIKTLGRIDDQELQKLYTSALAFVYPSLYEGFGLPVIEAQFCNCPVICADNSSIPEIAGDSALYFNAENTLQLAKQIELIYSDQSLRKSLIEKGSLNIKRFSWQKSSEKIANTVAKIYAQSLS